MQIGAQLYTATKRLQTLEDFDIGLGKIAEIGYRSVQVSGTCAYEPEWLRDTLQKHGLVCAITHIAPAKIIEQTEKVVADHAVFGCKNIGIGGMPVPMRGSLEGYEEFKKQFLPSALKIRDPVEQIMQNTKDVLQRILEDFPEDSIDFTLDLGWAAHGGQDVVELIRQLDGRLSRIHLKDYADKPEDGSITTPAYLRPIFEGKLPYADYINALKAAGCEYMLVEQDYSYGEDEFEILRRSYVNVTSRFPECK